MGSFLNWKLYCNNNFHFVEPEWILSRRQGPRCVIKARYLCHAPPSIWIMARVTQKDAKVQRETKPQRMNSGHAALNAISLLVGTPAKTGGLGLVGARRVFSRVSVEVAFSRRTELTCLFVEFWRNVYWNYVAICQRVSVVHWTYTLKK